MDYISKITLNNFTAFESLDTNFSPGINIFIGSNGTGKTHLLKILYSACDVTVTGKNVIDKIVSNFLPLERKIGRLVHRKVGSPPPADIEIVRKSRDDRNSTQKRLSIKFSNRSINSQSDNIQISGYEKWSKEKIESVYIPVKEMLANAPGFQSLYNDKLVHFEEIYADIIIRANRPISRGPMDKERKQLLKNIEKHIQGKVFSKNETFFLKDKRGDLEFTLLAEGLRKLGLLWILIQNNILTKGSVLFWDEPESNMNPKVVGELVEILLKLQRIGVQIFICTHDYVVLKEFDLRSKKSDKIIYNSLFYHTVGKKESKIKIYSSENYLNLHENMISDTFNGLLSRTIETDIK
jgi:ABC-type lipoprotein export system ATPase subunit